MRIAELLLFLALVCIVFPQISPSSIHKCECLNAGKCLSYQQHNYCQCPSTFIGKICQLPAFELTHNQTTHRISNTPSYFYQSINQSSIYYVRMGFCRPKHSPHSFTLQLQLKMEGQDQQLSGDMIYRGLPLTMQAEQCFAVGFWMPVFWKPSGQPQKAVVAVRAEHIHIQKDILQTQQQRNMQKQKQQQRTQAQKSINATSNQKSQTSHNQQSNLEENKVKIVDNRSVADIANRSIADGVSEVQVVVFSRRIQYQPIASYEQVGQMLLFLGMLTFFTFFASVIVCRLLLLCRQRRVRYTRAVPAQLINSVSHFQLNMPAHRYVQGEEGEKECMICLLSLNSSEVRRTPCEHYFHKSCIDKWGVYSLSCPACRSSLACNSIQASI